VARDAFARQHDATPDQLEQMVEEFVQDGVLWRGSLA
jgi:hypothetical protein